MEMLLEKTVDYEKLQIHGLFGFLQYMKQLEKYDLGFHPFGNHSLLQGFPFYPEFPAPVFHADAHICMKQQASRQIPPVKGLGVR